MGVFHYPDPYLEFSSRSITSKILLPKIVEPELPFLSNPYCGYNSFVGCGTDTAYFQPICSPDYCGCMVFTGDQGNPVNSIKTIFECPTAIFNFPHELSVFSFSIKVNYYYPLESDYNNNGGQKFSYNGIITAISNNTTGIPNAVRDNFWSFGVTYNGGLYFDIYTGTGSSRKYMRLETPPYTLANGFNYELEFRRHAGVLRFLVNGSEVPFSQTAGIVGGIVDFTIDESDPKPTNSLFLGMRSFQTVNPLTPLGIGGTGNLTGEICNFSIEINQEKVQETHFDCYGLQRYPDLWRDVVFGKNDYLQLCYGYPENCNIIEEYIPEGANVEHYAVTRLRLRKLSRSELIGLTGFDYGAHCGANPSGSPCPGNAISCPADSYRNSLSDGNPWHFLINVLSYQSCRPDPYLRNFEYGVSPQYNCVGLPPHDLCDPPCPVSCLKLLAPGSFTEIGIYDAFDRFLSNWINIMNCNYWQPSYGGSVFRNVDPDPEHAEVIFITDRRKFPSICQNLKNCYIRDFDGEPIDDPFESVYETFCCDYTVSYTTIDPIVSRKGSNGKTLFRCGNPFKRSLCTDFCKDQTYLCPDSDVIEFQFNLPDRLNNWDDPDNSIKFRWGANITSPFTFGTVEAYDFETHTKVDKPFDYFVVKHVVGAVKYQTEQTWTPIQILKINPYFLPCRFYFKITVKTFIGDSTLVFYTEPFEKIVCADKTVVIEGIYPDGTKDCFQRFYGYLDKGVGDWDVTSDHYSNKFRVFGEITATNISVETESKISTKSLRVVRSTPKENYRLLLHPIPPYMVDNLKLALTSKEVIVNGDRFMFNGNLEKNNETGLMWHPDVNLTKLTICPMNDFTCS